MSRLRSVAVTLWPLLQITAAATVAWVVARTLGDHPDPFFAPVAAIVALSSPLGERGRNAVHLVVGVLIGIIAGELTLLTLGGGYGRLVIAMLAATVVAQALGGSRLVIIQAAAGAVLTVASADGEVGIDRLIDALIGAGVALVGSQFLFAPEPVALIRRAEATALGTMARALDLTAGALRTGDDDRADRSLDELRTLRDDLVELARLRTAGRSVARHAVVWWHRRAPVVQETENAGQLDLLGGSVLTFARTAGAVDPDERAGAAQVVQELAAILRFVGEDPGDRATRQEAADRAVQLAADVADAVPSRPAMLPAAVVIMLRLVLHDFLVFAGVKPDDARRALAEGAGTLDIRTPPRDTRLRLLLRRRPRRA